VQPLAPLAGGEECAPELVQAHDRTGEDLGERIGPRREEGDGGGGGAGVIDVSLIVTMLLSTMSPVTLFDLKKTINDSVPSVSKSLVSGIEKEPLLLLITTVPLLYVTSGLAPKSAAVMLPVTAPIDQ
jgi:hypothetical protein